MVSRFQFDGCAFRVALGASQRSAFIEIILAQDVFAILVIVVTIQAFVYPHMVFMGEIDARPALTAVGSGILNIDLGILGI